MGEELVRIPQRQNGPDHQRPFEELLPQVLRPADGSQCRVQNGDPVTELLGFGEPVGGQKDRDPLLPEPGDQVVDLACGHRVETRGRLIEKHDRRVAEKRSGQPHPLTEPLGEPATQIVSPIPEVDGIERLFDPRPGVLQAIETGEVLQVLGDGQTQVETG